MDARVIVVGQEIVTPSTAHTIATSWCRTTGKQANSSGRSNPSSQLPKRAFPVQPHSEVGLLHGVIVLPRSHPKARNASRAFSLYLS